MAARTQRGTKTNPWSEEHRNRIKTSMLLNRLHSNVLKECMTAGQIKSVEILLRKVLPDLQAMTLSGDPDNPVEFKDVTDLEAAKKIAFLLTRAASA